MAHSVFLTHAAKADLSAIARYTADNWGKIQALKYASLLDHCFQRIAEGKDRSRTILAHNDSVRVCRCERHYIFYLSQKNGPVILAVLHEKMDLMERLKKRLPS